MTSLQWVLSVKPEQLFDEIAGASIAARISFPNLLFTGTQEIAIRKTTYPFRKMAFLPGESSMPFRSAVMCRYNGKPVIVGHTLEKCFYWNPMEHLFPVSFFKAPERKEIYQVLITDTGSELKITAYTGDKLYSFVDFKEVAQTTLDSTYYQVIHHSSTGRFYGFNQMAVGSPGVVLSAIGSEGQNIPLMTAAELWQLAKPAAFTHHQAGQHTGYTFLQGGFLRTLRWQGEEALVIRAKIEFVTAHATLLVVLSVRTGKPEMLSTVVIPQKLCLAFDTVANGNGHDLILGYLATGKYPEYLIEVVNAADRQPLIETDGRHLLLRSGGSLHFDIFSVKCLSAKRVLVLQKLHTLYDITLPDGDFAPMEGDYQKMEVNGIFDISVNG